MERHATLHTGAGAAAPAKKKSLARAGLECLGEFESTTTVAGQVGAAALWRSVSHDSACPLVTSAAG
jgi:hypothetical protein